MADATGASLVGPDGDAVDIVLASGSPRRLELLSRLGLTVDVRPADIDETSFDDESPADLVIRLARAKADATPTGPNEVVIAADTVVCVDGVTLGKPVDGHDAAAMLRRLSGRTHQVMTGVAVRRGEDTATAVETTEVAFRALGDDDVAGYVATGEPMDKAGSYAIQGAGGTFVTGIVGSDTNVVGLPLAATIDLLERVGVRLRLS